jgi:3-hydroxyisobutyrate dehydrogenase-like beta-hydroxyacid dehydrogenase
MTKEQAIVKILKVLKNPMMVMSVYNRDEALTLAEEYGITAKDLIEVWADLAMRV